MKSVGEVTGTGVAQEPFEVTFSVVPQSPEDTLSIPNNAPENYRDIAVAGLFRREKYDREVEARGLIEKIDRLDAKLGQTTRAKNKLAIDNALLADTVHGLVRSYEKRDDIETDLAISEAESAMKSAKINQLLRDNMTGLLVRGAWTDNVQHQLLHMRRDTDSKLGVVLLADLDLFKFANDSWGHLYGDEVLGWTGGAAKKALGEEAEQPGNDDQSIDAVPIDATAGRFGGEEVAVWLPGVTMQEARWVAEHFQAEVNKIEHPHEDNEATNTLVAATGRTNQGISIGMSTLQLDPQDIPGSLKNALENADYALYTAKNAGRNTIIDFESLGV